MSSLPTRRREFLKLGAASAFGASFAPRGLFAADDTGALYQRLIPARKELDPAWVQSLFIRDHEQDAPIRGSKAGGDLEMIGMTVGGIGCGTVYLSGDGRLYVWDIFNHPHEGVVPQRLDTPPEGLQNIAGAGRKVRERDGANYIAPPTPDRFPNPFTQDFRLRLGERVIPLDASAWKDVRFTGTWPVGRVDYRDPDLPVEVTLEAWSPFIPGDLTKSSLPATVVEITVKPKAGAKLADAVIEARLENPVCLRSRNKQAVELVSKFEKGKDVAILLHRATGDGLDSLPDHGTMALAGPGDATGGSDPGLMVKAAAGKPTRFILGWHFPNANLRPLPGRRRHYAARFADAAAVVRHVAANLDAVSAATREWVATYYDSTLPRWLLDRAAATTNTLQSATCLIFEDGRFWAWEGVGCCPGTCAHVWHYAQGPARLFPEIERNLREVTDYGIAQQPDGAIHFRAEANKIPAIDAQTGIVLRTWREHLCSADDGFLKRVWPGAKKAIGWLVDFDRNDPDGLDGLLHGEQHNTLDAEWFGKVHCLCSLYLAALRAGEEMATMMGDKEFAATCRRTWEKGRSGLAKLFNGEFFVQEEDPAHLDKIGVGKGCYIDQVIGQWWAHQVGLGRSQDEAPVRSALHALWRHNFVPDVGPFRKVLDRGRFYALPGDAGLVMCTWPRGGLRDDFKKHWQYGYFNECMTGFEWHVAAHMVMEGDAVDASTPPAAIDDEKDDRSFTLRGLAIARAIHDRYAPSLRNPYNEIECSDHYARAAASWSLLLAVTGFTYDGPAGILGFAPKLDPESFRAPFTAAEGWGTFRQEKKDGAWSASINMRHGRLNLRELRLPWIDGPVEAAIDGRKITATAENGRLRFENDLLVEKGSVLEISRPA